MKQLVNIVRVLVGVLFIFSGLVKANDPLGLSYKMQEFFDLWGMSALNSFTLVLSILVIAFEIIAGAALLLGWRIKLVIWLLLLLIVFFTLLTGYAYLSGKFKGCGCFGDCIPITSGTSFLKDIVLLVLILILLAYQKYIKPVFAKGITGLLLAVAIVFSFGTQWYTLKNLPVVDCLPFKIGGNIPELMLMPKDAVPDSTAIAFVYEKDGKEVEFDVQNFPKDFNEDTYKFIKRYDKVIKPGKNNKPPISGFQLTDEGGTDIAGTLLQQPGVFVLFMEDADTPIRAWRNHFDSLCVKASERFLPVFVVTSRRADVAKVFENAPYKNLIILNGDRTMIRTAARTNPTLYWLQNGVIINKWSSNHIEDAKKIFSQKLDFPIPAHSHADTIVF